MNTFGQLLRMTIFGESHGKKIGVIVDGCPAGLSLKEEDFLPHLQRRQPSAAGTTSRHEPDIPIIESGVMAGTTTGAPILISFENTDVKSEEYDALRETPRPGHADFVAGLKYGGFNDPRGGGTFSGRLTVALVSAGVIAKKILAAVNIEASLLEAGGTKDIQQAVQMAENEGDSVGGIIECRAAGLPVGLGEPFFDSVESLISHIMFSVPGIKGIEFGSGFAGSKMRGSEYNDVILDREGKTETNHAGGVNGGISNGNELIFRVAVRPTSSIKKEQRTVNIRTGIADKISVKGRHDVCIALRMPVIIESATAMVLADLMLKEQRIQRIVR